MVRRRLPGVAVQFLNPPRSHAFHYLEPVNHLQHSGISEEIILPIS